MTAPTPNAPAGERQPTVYDEAHPLAGVPMYADERRYVATLEADLAAARREVEARESLIAEAFEIMHSATRLEWARFHKWNSKRLAALAATPRSYEKDTIYVDRFGHHFRCIPIEGGWRREEVPNPAAATPEEKR